MTPREKLAELREWCDMRAGGVAFDGKTYQRFSTLARICDKALTAADSDMSEAIREALYEDPEVTRT